MCLAARHPSSQVQNRHQNRPGIVSDEIRHNKSPCVYLQRACITLSGVLRFIYSGDMSYGALFETTLRGFITVAYNSEWRNIWTRGEEEWGEKRGGGKKQENWSILLWVETEAFGWRTATGLSQRNVIWSCSKMTINNWMLTSDKILKL